MRPLRWVLAAAALAVGVSARSERSSVVQAVDGAPSLLAQDDEPTDEVSTLIEGPADLGAVPNEGETVSMAAVWRHRAANTLVALDDPTEDVSTLIEGADFNATERAQAIAQSVLMALDVVPTGVVSCNKGESSVKVMFALSICFTVDEMKAILNQLSTAITRSFYFNDKLIDLDLAWARYTESTCNTVLNGKVGTIRAWPDVGKKYDLWVNVAKNTGPLFVVRGSDFTADSTLDTRVCSAPKCPSPNPNAATTVSTVANYGSLVEKITAAMYCPDAAGVSPFTYTSDQRKSQCGCQCPGDFVPKSNKCQCPGELESLGNNKCGCTNGRSKTSNNKCVCSGGRVYSASTKSCACPAGTTLINNVCVKPCFWKADNEGFSCKWKDRTKMSLQLKSDCAITAPVPKDNYVADKRTNANDLTPAAALGAPTADPKITISATKKNGGVPQTKATSWLNYVLSPGNLEDDVKLGSFGVFDLSMVATDYRYEATCPGCVAVVDDYPPTPKQVCQTCDERSDKDIFTTAKLASHVAEETKFTYFYGTDNVQNNGDASTADSQGRGDNVRCDTETMEVVDFFKKTKTETASVGSKCFTTNYVKELLDSAVAATLPTVGSLVETDATASLVCERCCFKSIVLKEHVASYQCGVTTPVWGKQGTSTCKYGRCLQMKPEDLLTPSIKTTSASDTKTKTTVDGLPAGTVAAGDKVIRRSITCTSASDTDASCWVTETLSALLEKKAEWKAAEAIATGYDAANYVYWRYKAGATGTWAAWSDAASLTFTKPQTVVTLEAWSRCGMIKEFSFTVELHPHSTRNGCLEFRKRWADSVATPRVVDGNICAYPGSDFALLQFDYDSTDNVPHEGNKVKGKYTGITCALAVAKEGSSATMTKVSLPLTPETTTTGDQFRIAKQFAIELVKDATTNKNTDVAIECTLSFKYYDNEKVEEDKCPASLRLTDCDGPMIETFSTDVSCLPGTCGAPNGPAGPGETCGGEVFTTVETTEGVTSTATKATTDACCTGCSSALSCVPLTDTPTGVKRCEPPAVGAVLMALAMDESEKVAAVQTQAQAQTSTPSSMLTMLMGASAMVAVVALVVAKAHATKAKPSPYAGVDDAYVSLLD